MTRKRILVTSALPYANGPLHLGHIAGAYLPADIFVRYARLQGDDVLYICGSDEHGVPITVTADREGISPQDVVDRYHAMNKEAFSRLGISFDNYSRTTLPVHHETAAEFFTTLNDKGLLIIRESEQYYSEASGRFLPDRYVEGTCPHCRREGARGDQCDHCGKWLAPGDLVDPVSKIDGSVPTLKKTKHWYLPMGALADEWKTWFDGIEWPENVRNYCLGWYNEGLGDRPITRDLHWGVKVPLPEAEGKVLYVWFDAPIGYVSSTKEWAEKSGDPDKWKEYWCDPATQMVHFIGKDNIVFHAILFPMMLKQMDTYIRPSAIPANEYLTIEGRKISTSQNYAIWLKDYLELFPADPLRYSLAANAPESKDTDFSWKQFQSRNNDELADILGNFINRTITFIHKYFDGRVPPVTDPDADDEAMLARVRESKEEMNELYRTFAVRRAVKAYMDLCRAANKYFNDKEPWKTRKSDPAVCGTTLAVCVAVARALAVLGSPIIPASCRKIAETLGMKPDFIWDDADSGALPAGSPVKTPEILFQKIEDDVIDREIEKLQTLAGGGSARKEASQGAGISIDDFRTIEMRTARVIEAQAVEGADKLLSVTVDIAGTARQIIAGIARSYAPADLIGKQVIVVTNLKPVKIRGHESNGMLLAVKSGESYSLLTTDSNTETGIRVE
ncbi:methionine--tRNA ligase [bacterium]|nr:methionine--tRNA ligase [bacterium]